MSFNSSKSFVPPTIRRHKVQPPYVDLQVKTWTKDSHNLYDYEAEQQKFHTEIFEIDRNCRIYRHAQAGKTVLVYEQQQKKQMPMQYVYIAGIKTVGEGKNKTFLIQSSDVSGVQPHPFLRQDHPDMFKNTYIVVKDFEKEKGMEGFPLWNFVKIGRIQYLVIQISDQNQVKKLKQTSHLQLNTQIFKEGEELKGSCKVCLCEQASAQDPLINPCKCKGSCELIHVGCLKKWINNKVKKQTNNIAMTYNFSKFQCQICKTLSPKAIQLKKGQTIQMIDFNKPTTPYIILESVGEKFQRPENKERNLHVVSPNQQQPAIIGRGMQCEIRIPDISVSRTHAEIRRKNNKFYLVDTKSKFGTLIKFKQQYHLQTQQDGIKLQWGRSCFDFIIQFHQKTAQQIIYEERLNVPKFKTKAQLMQNDMYLIGGMYNYMQRVSLEILKLEENYIFFAMTGCDVSLVNALRRIMISEVPTLAPHLISIVQNSSVLHDEFLCQRLGLIPFVSDCIDEFKYPWQCSCTSQGVEDCQICKSHFVLQASNPHDEVMEVTSLHIRSVYDQLKGEEQEIRPVQPVTFFSSQNPNEKVGIPIVKLAKNQEIKVKIQVQKGIGKMHARWSPVSLASFTPDPDIKVDEMIELDQFQKIQIRDSCPTKVFEVHQNVFEVVLPQNCIFCGECKKKAESLDMVRFKNLLRIGKKKDRYLFRVQSVGQLTPINIVRKAMVVLREKLKTIEDLIK